MGFCRFCRKKKLKKMIKMAFKEMDMDMIKLVIVKLLDFDTRFRTNKTQLYLTKEIIRNPQLNEKYVLSLITGFHHIAKLFDQEVEEEIEDEAVVDVKLKQIESKRKEILIRKNQLKQQILAKNKRMKRRSTGAMG